MTERIKSVEVWGTNDLRYYGPQTRSILVTGSIDEDSANALSSQVRELNLQDRKKTIYVYINTIGGTIIDSIALYDTLMTVTNPIVTIVNGACYSSGLLIAAAGSTRLATPNSMYFYHQPTVDLLGMDSQEIMQSNYELYAWYKITVDELVRERIGMTQEMWDCHFGPKMSKFFNTNEARSWGFCTKILEFPTKYNRIPKPNEQDRV